MSHARIGFLVAGLAVASVAPAQTPAGDPTRGADVFKAQCSSCHSVKPGEHSIGPSLHGVVGRPAHGAPGFNYSKAMQGVDVTWTRANLDAYLQNPWSVAPGTPMALVVPNERNRRDVIAYLASLGNAPADASGAVDPDVKKIPPHPAPAAAKDAPAPAADRK